MKRTLLLSLLGLFLGLFVNGCNPEVEGDAAGECSDGVDNDPISAQSRTKELPPRSGEVALGLLSNLYARSRDTGCIFLRSATLLHKKIFSLRCVMRIGQRALP